MHAQSHELLNCRYLVNKIVKLSPDSCSRIFLTVVNFCALVKW